jgi:hypothetical protein
VDICQGLPEKVGLPVPIEKVIWKFGLLSCPLPNGVSIPCLLNVNFSKAGASSQGIAMLLPYLLPRMLSAGD